MIVVYKATHADGRVYIGITSRGLKDRRWHHESKAGKQSSHFSRALGKYGKAAFVWSIIEECATWEEACRREIFWIDHYDSTDPTSGFNLTKGGEKATHNLITKQRISDVVRLRMKQPKVIAAIVAANQRRHGHVNSAEHRTKIALSNGAKPFEVFNKETGEKVGEFLMVRDAAHKLNVDRGHIRNCLRGKNGYKSAGGYIFRWV
jgi:group I intron endonuclease